MKSTQRKKGFTLVELIVVIAIIAILAAVLIPTFAGAIREANLSADRVAVKEMNTVLMTEGVTTKPENATEVKQILKENGFNTNNMQPISSDYRFYWDRQENRIILVDMLTNVSVYPNGTEYTQGDNRYIPLDGIPETVVTILSAEELKDWAPSNLNGVKINMDTAVNYKAVDVINSDTYNESTYKDYYADFRVTFSKTLTYDGGNSISNGDLGFMLTGYYKAFGSYLALAATATTGTINADGSQTIYVMKDLLHMNGSDDQYSKYSFIVEVVQEFQCGIKAVYDLGYPTNIDFNKQKWDNNDRGWELLNGMTVTVELVLCQDKYSYEDDNHTTQYGYEGEEIVVHTYTYTYNLDPNTKPATN